MASDSTSGYREELRRVDEVEGKLTAALDLMDPAWSGLKDHPEVEQVNDRINEFRNAIFEARERGYFLRSAIARWEADDE